MSAKWTKAAFLIILGVILLFYSGGFVEELETNTADEWNMSFEWTWDLLNWLLWILVAWLFVYGALTIVLSFRDETYTLSDVMDRLDRIETLISSKKVRAPVVPPAEEPSSATVAEEPMADDEEPPPPSE